MNITKIERYVTTDNKEFVSEEGAVRHEKNALFTELDNLFKQHLDHPTLFHLRKVLLVMYDNADIVKNLKEILNKHL